MDSSRESRLNRRENKQRLKDFPEPLVERRLVEFVREREIYCVEQCASLNPPRVSRGFILSVWSAVSGASGAN